MIIDAPLFRRGGVLALAVLLAACSNGEGDSAGGKSGRGKRPPQLVSAQVAAMEDFAPTLLALGTVTPSQSVAVRPRGIPRSAGGHGDWASIDPAFRLGWARLPRASSRLGWRSAPSAGRTRVWAGLAPRPDDINAMLQQ
jgi:hypothetical protein